MARAEAYLRAKFHIDPSNRLATIHQRHRQDRTLQTGQTDRQDRQRSDSIGRTVLQTIAQKSENVRLWNQLPTELAASSDSIVQAQAKNSFVHCVIRSIWKQQYLNRVMLKAIHSKRGINQRRKVQKASSMNLSLAAWLSDPKATMTKISLCLSLYDSASCSTALQWSRNSDFISKIARKFIPLLIICLTIWSRCVWGRLDW